MTHMLLEGYLKDLKLSCFAKDYASLAEMAQEQKQTYQEYLEALAEREVNARRDRSVERRMKQAGFPMMKTLDGFDFKRVETLDPKFIFTLVRGEWIEKRESVIVLGKSGMGKSHLSIALGIGACQQGYDVLYKGVAQLSQELMEARDERALLNYKKRLEKYDLLILDELGYVPLNKEGAELLFDVFSSRHEKGSILVNTNLPFSQWTDVFLCPRLTGALLDRLTHKAHILEMNGESYRLQQAKQKGVQKDTYNSLVIHQLNTHLN